MKMGSVLIYTSAAIALGAAITSGLGPSQILPAVLALMAAATALAAGIFFSKKPASPVPDVIPAKTQPQLPIAPPATASPSIAASDFSAVEALAAKNLADAEANTSMALALVELRYVDAVLSKVSGETESAAFSLMERLLALRNQSEKASQSAATADGDLATSTTIGTLADNAKATITRVRTALSEMRKHDKTAAAGLQALGKELTAGMELLAEIGEITERSRLIAFNMAIEAARIGSQGNGFKVIVGELRNLNDQTAVFSKRVSDLLGRFKKFNESLVEKSVKDSAIVAEEVERGIQDEEKAIESLLMISHACVDLSGDIEQVVISMNKDLDGILESLQFQDITRQMVEGVQFMVSEVRDEMNKRIQPSDGSPALKPGLSQIKELRSRLLSLAHTKGEKEAIQEVII